MERMGGGGARNPFFRQATLCGVLSIVLMGGQVALLVTRAMPQFFVLVSNGFKYMGFLFLLIIILVSPAFIVLFLLIASPIFGAFTVWNCGFHAKRDKSLGNKEARTARRLMIIGPLLFALSIALFLLILLQIFGVIG